MTPESRKQERLEQVVKEAKPHRGIRQVPENATILMRPINSGGRTMNKVTTF
jgi:hypothetical protein